MKKTIGFAISVVILLMGCRYGMRPDLLQLYDLESGRAIAGQSAIEQIANARLIVIGEHHSSKWHHQAQLSIIEALHRAGKPVAIGLEMFRQESQDDLDRWIAGQTEEEVFKRVYLDNWNFNWQMYRPIFEYAREQSIPMIGLNVPRGVSSQVAHQGFASLSDDQRAGLETITCDITPAYREYIRKAYGAHAHGAMKFEHFCEAQVLWDAAMAQQALRYLKQHPDTTMVLLAGSGHARKPGIPAQVRHRGAIPMVVLLPAGDGIAASNTTVDDADYLITAF